MFSFPESTVNSVVARVYPFPPPARCEREGVFISTFNNVNVRVYRQCEHGGVLLSSTIRGGRKSVYLSTVNNVNVRVYRQCEHMRVYPFSPLAGMDARVYIFPHQQCKREAVVSVNMGVYPFSPLAGMDVRVYIHMYILYERDLDVQGVSLCTASSTEVQGVSFSTFIQFF